jgi:hypothetical protein
MVHAKPGVGVAPASRQFPKHANLDTVQLFQFIAGMIPMSK